MPFRPEKSYKNIGFLKSTPARSIRILCEYEEPKQRFAAHRIEDTIVFFGSARAGCPDEACEALERAQQAHAQNPDDAQAQRTLARAQTAVKLSPYYDAARNLSRRLTQWDLEREHARHYVVCTGGGPGIMEAANRGAADVPGGRSVGLGISLPFEPGVNAWVTRELAFEFNYFFTRKFWFMYLMKACIVFPGGFGTLDELYEVLTLLQTGKVTKHVPVVLFGAQAYWDKILNFEVMAEVGVIAPADLDLVYRTDDLDDAFSYLTRALEHEERNHRHHP